MLVAFRINIHHCPNMQLQRFVNSWFHIRINIHYCPNMNITRDDVSCMKCSDKHTAPIFRLFSCKGTKVHVASMEQSRGNISAFEGLHYYSEYRGIGRRKLLVEIVPTHQVPGFCLLDQPNGPTSSERASDWFSVDSHDCNTKWRDARRRSESIISNVDNKGSMSTELYYSLVATVIRSFSSQQQWPQLKTVPLKHPLLPILNPPSSCNNIGRTAWSSSSDIYKSAMVITYCLNVQAHTMIMP
jgi:hypothetical protein